MTPAASPEPPAAAAAEEPQVTVRLKGQLSINDVLLELGQAPVLDPCPDADAGDTNFF
ncbi:MULTISPECIES: hypothetical protein [Arthrobacter]|uniref:hypothetical protein n=1 Tax=Arthrobacter TaxID=1663 RepID=UPI001606A13A|nr:MULTISPECIES: hypothetical protein [Arthrobacter]QYF90266.1 hypothetical protein KY499_02715 [Arthrobacter sp. PAMC25284]